MRIRDFGFVALLLVCLVSCNKFRNLEYTISKPYCKDIVYSKAVAMSSTVPVKSGLSENGNALCHN